MTNIEINSIIEKALETIYNLVIIDKNERIIYMNNTYARMLGTSPEQAIGKNVKDIIINTKLPEVLKTGKGDTGSIFIVHNNVTKEEKSIICNRYPLIKGGEVIGVLAVTIFQNMDEIQKLNDEIEVLRQKNEMYRSQLDELRNYKYSVDTLLGESHKMNKLKDIIYKVSDTNLPVLITGETGTGKEVFANVIHQLSSRRTNGFVKINCAAIPENLLESELFGYEDGAFTGARKGGKIGKFELANGGTILLDEISEMPLNLQSKLLRVLQEREFERVGGIDTINLDVRLICSTNENILDLIKNGKFREDLYYRINSVEIEIPPLRDRLCDLQKLCEYFIKKTNIENGVNILGIEDDVIELFITLPWSGNVRELENAIERACVIVKTGMLNVSNFKFLLDRIDKMAQSGSENLDSKAMSLEDVLERSERDEIIKALESSRGNKTKAAKLLNIHRSVLYNRIKKYDIDA